jgi:hypothetical protein
MLSEDRGEEGLSNSWGIVGVVRGSQVDHLGEAIHEDRNCGETTRRLGELDNEVHAYWSPRSWWDRERLEESKGMLMSILLALASVAGLDVFLDVLRHSGPEVVTSEFGIENRMGGVSRVDRVVLFSE